MTHRLSESQGSESQGSDARIDGLMERLRRDAEKLGWQFFVRPPPQLVPEFLKGHCPYALGMGPGGGTVVEIRTRWDDGRKESLAGIARLVEAQAGWTFRVFYVSPPAEAGPELAAPTAGELASGIAEARVLLDGGHGRAALLIAWAVLEATARTVAPEGEGTRPLSPIQVVQALAEMGYLKEVDARRLRHLASLRNAVVHGSLGTAVPADEVARLIRDLEGITQALDEAA